MSSSTRTLPCSAPAAAPAGSTPTPLTSIFLPKEHGSWSLALEPLLLGLLVAPSLAGGALATAAFTGFLCRRPLKTWLTARDPSRRRMATHALTLLASLAWAGILLAAQAGGTGALWPLLFAMPFGGLFLFFDLRHDGRAAAAELAGSAAFAFIPTALVTLASWPAPAALALALLALARSLPTVLTVRAYLRHAKGETDGSSWAAPAATAAAALLGWLLSARLVPETAVLAGLGLLTRTLWLASPWRPAWPARRIGQLEAALGVLYVGLTAWGYQGNFLAPA